METNQGKVIIAGVKAMGRLQSTGCWTDFRILDTVDPSCCLMDNASIQEYLKTNEAS